MSNKNNSTKSVTTLVNVPKEQLKDDVVSKLMNGMQCTEQEALRYLDRYTKQQQYRSEYAQRPEVVEKRKEYARRRYQQMKLVAEMLRS